MKLRFVVGLVLPLKVLAVNLNMYVDDATRDL